MAGNDLRDFINDLEERNDLQRIRVEVDWNEELGAITREVFLHEKLGKYIRRLVGATRPYNAETDWLHRSPSDMVEQHVDLGASPRATIAWGRLVKVWAVLVRRRSEVYPEDVQDLAKYVLAHRIWLGPHATSHGVTSEQVIEDIIAKVPRP